MNTLNYTYYCFYCCADTINRSPRPSTTVALGFFSIALTMVLCTLMRPILKVISVPHSDYGTIALILFVISFLLPLFYFTENRRDQIISNFGEKRKGEEKHDSIKGGVILILSMILFISSVFIID